MQEEIYSIIIHTLLTQFNKKREKINGYLFTVRRYKRKRNCRRL